MRIISGTAKGRALKVPREVARPTTDRVRESLFGILHTAIDLYPLFFIFLSVLYKFLAASFFLS